MAALVLAWPGAIAIGLSLGLLGSGGSILTVPVLVYLLGQPEKLAIASSLAIVGLIAAAGSVPYMRTGLVNWRAVALFGVPGMAGTYLGAWLALFVPGAAQLVLFAVVMLAASVLMIRPLRINGPGEGPGEPRALWKITLDGLAVGVVTGLVGVGGGFLVVPALVLLGGLPMRQAVATSLVIIALKSFSGFYKYLDVLAVENIELDLKVITLVSALGIIGTFAGNAIGGRLDQEKLKKTFGAFLIVMGTFVLIRSVPALL
ncbi:MAG: sulfite exporter TauE/SafE family protein [Pseudomonadales bacterium]